VIFFPVDEGRDIDAFLRAQDIISRAGPITDEDELVWLQNNVNSRALSEHLRSHAETYDRIVMGPYLFGLVYCASQIAPSKTILVPCLHDEPFARLGSFRKMFNSVRTCMFNTEPERDLACRLYRLDPGKSTVVGMGMEPFDADPTAFAKAQGLSGPYVLYSGRREPLKGTPLLVDYLAAFRGRTGRDVKLVSTGTGEIPVNPALSPHVIDMGFVPEREKQEAMAGAAAFCHPSVNESLGIVILEAWLARTAVLVHAGSVVLREHCRRSNGGLWFRNYPEFEQELLFLLDNREAQASFGEAGRQYVLDHYSSEVIDSKLLHALDGD